MRIAKNIRDNGTQEFSASTILRWVSDFRTLGGFRRDSRGVHERDWIMSDEDLRQALVTWMRSKKRLTVHAVREYINKGLFADEMKDVSRLHLYQVHIPVSLSTTHQWMTRLGCKYGRTTKSYYTDTREKEEVVKYRSQYV
ncbi:unnamed protein product, partial [Hapterophycus canaliculatus]